MRRFLLGCLLLLFTTCREDDIRVIEVPEPPVEEEETIPPVTVACPPYCPPPPPHVLGRTPQPNPIPAENAKPGDPDWRAGRVANAQQVELYASVDSVEVGETVRVRVSTDLPSEVEARVYRIGHYGGAGAREVWRQGGIAVGPQPSCPRDVITGLIECPWKDSFAFEVGADWVSGLYLVKVIRSDGYKRFAPLVVRDRRAADLLFQPAFNTSLAYNLWGGTSLYADVFGDLPTGRAVHVSYDRPFENGEGAGFAMQWEVPLVQLIESQGYDVTYASNLDFGRFEDVLVGVGAFVHGGHDEYWLSSERVQLDQALSSGNTSLAYFGANGGYWRVRMLSNSGGQPMRIMVCHKGTAGDPYPGSTVRFRDPPNENPENALFGTMYEGWMLIPFPLAVANPSHWLFAGTGLAQGELLHGLVGNEYDKIFPGPYSPAGLAVSMEGPVVNADGLPSRMQVVDRVLPSGRVVFSAGTFYWAYGVGPDPELADGRVARMTLNVLERVLSHRVAPRVLPPAAGPTPPAFPPNPAWASSVSAVAGTVGVSGWVDGVGSSAQFEGLAGLAVTPSGQVIVADASGNRIRMIDADASRTVSTLAGNGLLGLRDGPGAQAMFRTPTGVAVGPDGAVYVADSDNHMIRRVSLVPPYEVSIWAGATRTQGHVDGPPQTARFRRPTALAFDGNGHLYVADQNNNRIRKVAAGTREVRTIAGNQYIGHEDHAVGTEAVFNNPSAIAVGPNGDIYVLDGGTGMLRRISSVSPYPVTTLAGAEPMRFGYRDGPGTEARFRAQLGMAVTPAGELFVADTANYRVRKVVPGVDAASTQVYTIAGTGRVGSALGTGDQADLVAPTGLAIAPNGLIYISDSYNQVVRVIVR